MAAPSRPSSAWRSTPATWSFSSPPHPPTHTPDGFTAGADWSSWELDAAVLDALGHDVDDVVAPLPALVTLGHDPAADTTVMVNLGAVGVVALDGDLQAALGHPEPVELVGTLDECHDRLRNKASAMRDLVDEAQVMSVDELRLAGTDTVDLGPSIVICLEPPLPQAAAELAALAGDPASGVSAVIAAGRTAAGWSLDIDADGTLEKSVSPQPG